MLPKPKVLYLNKQDPKGKGYIVKTITLTSAVAGQYTKEVRSYNKELFIGERETVESFNPSDYELIELLDTKSSEAQTYEVRGAARKELVVAIDSEFRPQLINANSTSYNGETQVTVTSQELTLAGFNYFTKQNDSQLDWTDYYNRVLERAGYEISVDDIKTLGEFKSEYNCTTLSFTVDGVRHWLTVNSHNQLSSIKSRDLDTTVTAKSSTPDEVPASILG